MSGKLHDIVGQTYNILTVIKFAYMKAKRSYWLCKCICGNEKIIEGSKLRNNHTRSCGCLSHKHAHNFVDITGRVFGRWTVIKFLYTDKNNKAIWLCKCSCGGKEGEVSGSSLRSRKSTSCSCYKVESYGVSATRHGMSQTRIYVIWANIIQRCTNVKNTAYKAYGGNNITIYKPWLNFETFYADNGESYNKHVAEFGEKETTFDRFPNQKGNYEPGNVRWATYKEQALNTGIVGKSENPVEHLRWKNYFSTSLSRLIRLNCKTSPTIEPYLNCSLRDFRKHIESLWLLGMTWDNYGFGSGKWNFDHIIGCNNFDLSKEEDRRRCSLYTNIHPMWHDAHMSKSKFLVNV